MKHSHYRGSGLHLSGRLYMFCGMTAYESWQGSRKAEVYDFKTGSWTDLPDTPDGYNVDSPEVPPLPLQNTFMLRDLYKEKVVYKNFYE